MIRITQIAVILLMIAGLTNACYYDNEEELYPEPPSCDTSNVTYSLTIAPMFDDQGCVSCHNAINPSGQVILDNYPDVKKVVDDGSLWGSVDHEAGFEPMPQNGPKMSECNLSKIRIWLDDGAPNN